MKIKLFIILLLFIVSTALYSQEDTTPTNDKITTNAEEDVSTNVEEKLSSAEKQLAETILLLEQKNTELEELGIKLIEVQESLGVIEGKNETANTNYTQMMSIQKEIDNYQKSLDKTNSSIEKVTNNISSIEENISNIENTPANFEEANIELNTYQEELTKLETKLSELETKLSELETQIKAAKKENPEADTSELETQKAGLKNNISQTKSQISETKKNVSEISKTIKGYEKIIASSEEDLNIANSKLEILKQELANLTTSKNEIEIKIDELKNNANIYATAISELEIDTSDSKKLSEESESQLVGKEKIRLSKSEIKSLSRDIKDRKIEIAELELYIAELEYLADSSRVTIAEDNVFSVVNENIENPFLRYMKGKSRIGMNFAPNMSIYGLPMLLTTAQKFIPAAAGADVGLKVPSGSFSMMFSYDFAVLPFMALSFEAGFASAGLRGTYGGENYNFDYDTIPYSFGLKFFPGQKAPWGFYLLTKIGGTDVNLSGEAVAMAGGSDTISGHGIYAALELGWHVQLFPNMGKYWPVQIGLDIGLFDLGYYFVPWATEIAQLPQIADSISSFEWALNIRAVFLPRLGISIRF